MRRGGDGVEGRAGGGGLSPWSSDFGEPAPPKHNLGASPLNSLNLIILSCTKEVQDSLQKNSTPAPNATATVTIIFCGAQNKANKRQG